MEKQERKKKIGNLPETTEAYKKKFIEKLEKGYSASIAAKMIDVSRKTVYNWRNGDPEFAADWDDAIEAAIDLVETRLYQRAIKHSDSNAQFILRARRADTAGRKPRPPALPCA